MSDGETVNTEIVSFKDGEMIACDEDCDNLKLFAVAALKHGWECVDGDPSYPSWGMWEDNGIFYAKFKREAK